MMPFVQRTPIRTGTMRCACMSGVWALIEIFVVYLLCFGGGGARAIATLWRSGTFCVCMSVNRGGRRRRGVTWIALVVAHQTRAFAAVTYGKRSTQERVIKIKRRSGIYAHRNFPRKERVGGEF